MSRQFPVGQPIQAPQSYGTPRQQQFRPAPYDAGGTLRTRIPAPQPGPRPGAGYNAGGVTRPVAVQQQQLRPSGSYNPGAVNYRMPDRGGAAPVGVLPNGIQPATFGNPMPLPPPPPPMPTPPVNNPNIGNPANLAPQQPMTTPMVTGHANNPTSPLLNPGPAAPSGTYQTAIQALAAMNGASQPPPATYDQILRSLAGTAPARPAPTAPPRGPSNPGATMMGANRNSIWGY